MVYHNPCITQPTRVFFVAQLSSGNKTRFHDMNHEILVGQWRDPYTWNFNPYITGYNPLYKTIKRAFEHCSIGKGFHTLPGKKSRLEKPNKDMDDGGGLEVDDFSRFGEKGWFCRFHVNFPGCTIKDHCKKMWLFLRFPPGQTPF